MKRTHGGVLAAVVTLSSGGAVAGDWSGFYVGAGVTFGEYEMGLPDSSGNITINDSSTPDVDFQTSFPLGHTGKVESGHLLAGYMFQKGRLVFGAEADMEFDAVASWPRAIGIPGCANPPIVAPGNFSCIGIQSFGSVESVGHARVIAGAELTPTLMGFLSGGLAIGMAGDALGVTAGGFMADSPAPPLLGVATVLRTGMAETLYGYTIGGGVQLKASRNLMLRAEYIYDNYGSRDIAVGGAGFGGTIGTVTANSFGSIGMEQTHSSHAVRLAAIYQFGDGGGDPAAEQDLGDWSGIYFGGGLSLGRTRMALPDSSANLTIDDNTTPETDFQTSVSLDHEGDTVSGHLLAGYMFQAERFVFGGEGDMEFGNSVDFPRAAGVPACANPAIVTPGYFSCIGMQSFGSFETLGHVRAIAGAEVTPSLMGFVSGGIAIGRSGDRIGVTTGGIVAHSPSSPLIGVATVSRGGMEEIMYGYTIGGGAQFKASRNLMLRAEYIYDDYGTRDIAVGGAGFGGTLDDVTTNSFASIGNQLKYSSHAVRLSAIFKF
ncbi:MAG: hypothetical protein WAU86_14340 [Oricola sp.]